MRILIVEDEKKVAEFIPRGLRAERYAVDMAHDGRVGLDMSAAYAYYLLILDPMLPGLSGIDLLRQIRRGNQYNPSRVLTVRADTAA